MAWSSSTRRSRLPSDWPKRRARVKARAKGMCEAEVHEPECDGFGSQCDHHINNDDHSLSNLRWLSEPCHAAKTKLEAAAGRAAMPRAKREPESHPGLI